MRFVKLQLFLTDAEHREASRLGMTMKQLQKCQFEIKSGGDILAVSLVQFFHLHRFIVDWAITGR